MYGRSVLNILMLLALLELASAQVPATPTPIATLTPQITGTSELPFECKLCFSDEDCKWCGPDCYNPKRCPNVYCLAIAPPSDKKCACIKMNEYHGHKLPEGTGICMAVSASDIKVPHTKKVNVSIPMPSELPITVCIDDLCKEIKPQQTVEIPSPPKPEVCPAVFMPVCGIDGRTYSNLCEAWKAGVPVACKKECPCIEILNLSIRHLVEIKPGEIVKVELEKELSLTLKPKEMVKTMQVIVSKIKEPPVKEKPPGLVYAYYEISPVSDQGVRAEGNISFAVKKSWIVENRIKAENIRLARYNATWEILKTEIVSEDSEFVYYRAELPGFSYFAVISETPSPTPTPMPTPKPPAPGFEAIFAIAALFAVAYLLRKIRG